MRRVTRRNFLKGTGTAVLALGTGATLDAVLSGCASTSTELALEEKTQVIYPPLKGHKVQPPENGCLVGFHRKFGIDPKWNISRFEENTGKKPAWLTFCCNIPLSEFPMESAILTAEQGIIPNISPDFVGFTLEEIAKGASDLQFEHVAREAVQFGQQHGGFFYTPMPEINLRGPRWGQQPSQAKKAWQHVWQIFEDQGANEYATWVWEVITPECTEGIADSPSPYYPGDKYVDWIGLSTYSRNQFGTGNMSYNQLSAGTYHEMLRTHHDKPIMQAEFGKTQSNEQPYWIKNAYKTIKSWPGMKAALYWDQPDLALGDNLQLSDESFTVLKEILKDPYWITAK